MMTCKQCRDQLDEFALGQTGSVVTGEVDGHLRQCSACRRELTDIEAAWSALPLALEPMSPSPAKRSEITASFAVPGGVDRAVADRSAPAHARILSRRARLASYALAAGVAVGLTIAALSEWDRPSTSMVRSDDEQAVLDLAQRLGNLQQMERMLGSGEMKLATLHRPQADATQAYVVWDLAARQWHFFAVELPPAPAGQTYQLWAGAGHDAEPLLPGPTFKVNSSGVGSAVGKFPALDSHAVAKAVVTIEPEGGSPQPTGEVVLEAAL